MKASDSLFLLIQSLEKNEKLYFRKYAAVHAQDNGSLYLYLYELIERQNEYDEPAIVSQLKKDEKIKIENFSRTKNYLHNLILKCLRNYHDQSNIENEISGMLTDIALLFNKNLYKDCRKLINKAKKTAAFYEKFSYQLEILKWERRIILLDPKVNKIEKELKINFGEDNSTLGMIENIAEYNRENLRMFVMAKKTGRTRDSRTIKHFRESLNQELFKSDTLAMSYSAKVHYYRTLSSYYLNIGDSRNSYKYNKQLIELIQKNPHQITDEPGAYLGILNNHIIHCSQLKKFEEFRRTIEEIRSIPGKYLSTAGENLRMRIFSITYSAECNLYIETGQINKARQLTGHIIDGLELYKNKLSTERSVIFWYQLSYVYFALGDFSSSRSWINKILNMSESEIRRDIYGFARIFNLIIHYELNNFDLLEYNIRSTYRYFKEKLKLFRLERIFFDFLKEISHKMDRESMEKSFLKFRTLIKPLRKDPYEKRAFEFFDFTSWIDSKIENKPFIEIIDKKIQNKRK